MTDKNRISRVVTRSGDRGDTGLADGSRVRKDAPRIEAMGELDELSAALGVLAGQVEPQHRALLEAIQQCLFEAGAELALPGQRRLAEDDLAVLDDAAARLNDALPALREFLLPGGAPAAAWCHYCRTLARRAERRVVVLAKELSPVMLQFMNRLSDVLFILARTLNREAGVPEPLWQPRGGSAPR